MTEDLDTDVGELPEPETPVPADFRCGFVAIVGRPNVGKSTLLNAVLGRKVSIVSPKPQTTRHRILGMLNQPTAQIVFVDTPGLHTNERRAMNRYMNRAARASLSDADVNLFVVEALTWTDEDAQVLDYLKRCNRPTVLIVNKVDTVYPKERLLPYMQEMQRRMEFVAIVPLSGLKRNGVDQLPELLAQHLPLSPPHFPLEQITDRSEQFQATEVIREKLTLRLNQELPYGITVQVERFELQEDGRLLINAVIWVERPGQKAIVIGQGGANLKEVGRMARLELNHLFDKSVHLELWVKVKENWSDSEAALRQLGFE
jgi:GTPase